MAMQTLDIPNTEIAAAQIECLTVKMRELLAVAKDVERTFVNIDVILATIGQRKKSWNSLVIRTRRKGVNVDIPEYQLQVKSDDKDWEAFGHIYEDDEAAKKQLAVVRSYVNEFRSSQRRHVQYRLVMRMTSPWCEVAE